MKNKTDLLDPKCSNVTFEKNKHQRKKEDDPFQFSFLNDEYSQATHVPL